MKTEKKEEPEQSDHEPGEFRNPLWIVVSGMAVLFGVLLTIMAMGGVN